MGRPSTLASSQSGATPCWASTSPLQLPPLPSTCAAVARAPARATSSSATPGGRAPVEAAEARASWELRLGRLNQVVFSTVAAAALMLDVTLWGVLYPVDHTPGHPGELNFCSYNMHAVNLIWVVTELYLNNIQIRLNDLALALWWVLIYGIFTILRVALNPSSRSCLTQSGPQCESDSSRKYLVWPYFFMDTAKPLVLVWFLGLLVLFSLAYLAMWRFSRCLKPLAPLYEQQPD
eukprot:CAMPEP_0177519104 /NCGR_PEP_ID=MMETSP0369-20130122/46902_1 /TAXON_ID=447022 ORGANISM="Scrippsiella hangoei-like, Strain SHHI-4" /NCGR_SAMPLE_ID=MMETSP0369 /ASSEMBLY_ACC=CAM_ASM_000364 /LENGTH=234 /DNA_ID=CAMNT_0018998299 /DNA_START=90 /DNA_END=791 /DNA_ORIENTATION=+